LPISWSGIVDGIPCSVVISCLTFEWIFVLVLGEGFRRNSTSEGSAHEVSFGMGWDNSDSGSWA